MNGNRFFILLMAGCVCSCTAVSLRSPPQLTDTIQVQLITPPEPVSSQPGGLKPDSVQVQQALRALDGRTTHYPRDYEAYLLKGLIYYETRQFDRALTELDRVVSQAPRFHLAQMIRGDILLSRVAQVSGIGHNPVLHALPDSRYVLVEDLREEARTRIRAYLHAQDKRKLPGQLLRMGESVETAVLVDKQTHRLYLYGNTGADSPPELLYDFYVSTGRKRGNKAVRGDLRTPEGVYFVTSYTPGSQLPEKYGAAAFPINYPNELDQYQRKTGGGIWLHGITQRFYSRPPLDSEGCIVLSNIDLEHIVSLISPGSTPFIIAEHLDWLEQDVWLERKNELIQTLQTWQEDWESGDTARYLANYAPGFWGGGYDFDGWSRMKKKMLPRNNSSRISVNNLSLLAYSRRAEPGREIVIADFQLTYSAGDSNGSWKKRLYLEKNQDRWYVLHEANMRKKRTTMATVNRL